MNKKKPQTIPRTKDEAIAEAKRYLKNAKEILSQTDIRYGKIYEDAKIVREAAGVAYLAALKALDGYLLGKGISPEKLPASIEEYFSVISKIPKNGKLKAHLSTAYENLHIFAYYRGGVSVDMIKAGIKSVEEIIKMLG
jgi:hypothetical protein